MKKTIISLAVFSILSGCYHEVETPDPVIDHPPLSLQADFEALVASSNVVTMDAASSRIILADVISRYMNVVEIANQTADLVAVSDFIQPVKYKTMSRAVYVENASNEYCSTGDGETGGNEAGIWDDRDNSQTATAGDVWYYRLDNCQSRINSAFVTGLIGQTGMQDQFSPGGDADVAFSDYIYTIDMQIDPQNGKVAYLKNNKLTFNRTDEANTSLTISDKSLMGVSAYNVVSEEDDSFIFRIEDSLLENDDDADTLKVSITARYYDSVLDGYVDVSTPTPLMFEYTYNSTGIKDENNPYESILLTEGVLKISTGNDFATLSVDSANADNVEFLFNDDSGSSDVVAQSELFNVQLNSNTDSKTFSLVNLTD